MRFTAAVILPALLLLLLEAGLRLVGYGYPTSFFVPANDRNVLTTNPSFAWQFYARKTATSPTPIRFSKVKAPGTRRVFILGESAAAGTPDPAFGFARMLDVILRERYPSNRFEVLNVAMRGIDSHIIRRIASECAELAPDLFVLYMGNNDVIGLHGPSPGEFTLTSNIRWLRFKEAIFRLKLAQAVNSLIARLTKGDRAPKQDQEFFRGKRLAFDDPLRAAVYRNFEVNLRDICRTAERAGAQALVCSVAVNLRDFPPLASLHRKSLSAGDLALWEKLYADGIAAEQAGRFIPALESYAQAAKIDDHFADLLFRMARCSEALGNIEDARRYFSLARDRDAIQFRTDSRLNDIARSVASTSGPNVRLADVEKRCAESPLAPRGLTGQRLFQEHVHFNFDGDHVVASTLASDIAALYSLPPPTKPDLSRNDCAKLLAYTEVDDYNVRSSIARLTANPPFLDQIDHAVRQARMEGELQARAQQASPQIFERAIATYREAINSRPDDWMLRYNLGNILRQTGQHQAAALEFAQVVEQLPNQRAFRVAFGDALLASGRSREAADQFQAALKLDPDLQVARQGLQAANARLR
jgi:tetratricopeptide (TPR) repeat protein